MKSHKLSMTTKLGEEFLIRQLLGKLRGQLASNFVEKESVDLLNPQPKRNSILQITFTNMFQNMQIHNFPRVTIIFSNLQFSWLMDYEIQQEGFLCNFTY